MSRFVALVLPLALVACGSKSSEPTTPTPPAEPVVAIGESGLAPITQSTRVDVPTLAPMFPGLELKIDPENPTDVVEAWLGTERWFYVVAKDEDQLVYGIHATSPKVAGPRPEWRVGQALTSTDGLDDCECWGGQADADWVLGCFATGSRFGVVFEPVACGAPASMIGQKITRLVWQPNPWEANSLGQPLDTEDDDSDYVDGEPEENESGQP